MHDASRSTAGATLTTSLRARLDIDTADYDVLDLSHTGFGIHAVGRLADGTPVHVSFLLEPGLSISLQAAARAPARDGQQWFDFVDPDPDVLALLLVAREPPLLD